MTPGRTGNEFRNSVPGVVPLVLSCLINLTTGTTWGRKPEKSGFVTRSSRYGTAGLNPTKKQPAGARARGGSDDAGCAKIWPRGVT